MSDKDRDLCLSIGASMKAIRKARHLTLQEVADRADLAKSYVWELERGERTNPSILALVALSKALGTSLDQLVGLDTFVKPALRPEAMRIAVQVDELLRDAMQSPPSA